MRINTNIGALTAANNLTRVNDAVRGSSEKLSSGFRINKASDDAAGLGVANTFRADIRALTQAQRNAEQATAVYSIAEGGATSIQKLLERMKELAAQSASDSVDDVGRQAISAEFTGLVSEIDRVTSTTEFQGQKLLSGSYGNYVATTAVDGGTMNSGLTVGGSITGISMTDLGKLTVGDGTNGILGVGYGTITFAAAAGTNSGSKITATMTTATGVTVSQVMDDLGAATVAQTLNFDRLGLKISISNGYANVAAVTAAFNGKSLIAAQGKGSFLIGAARSAASYTSTASNVLQIDGGTLNLSATKLGVNASSVTTRTVAATALLAIDTALSSVNAAVGAIGAGQNRLTNAIDNIKSTILNYQAAESTIRDLDMASEMVAYSKNQILAQAGTAMLAQANQSGQGILKLLQ